MDYLQEQDEIMCRKIHQRKPSMLCNIGFITLDKTNNPKCNTKTPSCARAKNIFDMRYIFIPIPHGLHFMCAVIYMEQMKIKYYNSLHLNNVTRHGCRHKVKMQEDTLQVQRDYLQNKHMRGKRID
jgi:Ulp1 family protease